MSHLMVLPKKYFAGKSDQEFDRIKIVMGVIMNKRRFHRLIFEKKVITLESRDLDFYEFFRELLISVINKYSEEKFTLLFSIPEF